MVLTGELLGKEPKTPGTEQPSVSFAEGTTFERDRTGKLLRHLTITFEPVHEISNKLVCATSKASDQPVHTHSLIRALASRLSIL